MNDQRYIKRYVLQKANSEKTFSRFMDEDEKKRVAMDMEVEEKYVNEVFDVYGELHPDAMRFKTEQDALDMRSEITDRNKKSGVKSWYEPVEIYAPIEDIQGKVIYSDV